MKHLFLKLFLGIGIVAAMILSLSTYTSAVIIDPGKPIAEIETILQRVETSKIVQLNDEPFETLIDKLCDHWIEGMKRERIAAGNDKNKLNELQKVAKNHEIRLRAVENRIKVIEGKIKTGEIRLSKPVLQTMNQTEIEEFRKFLLPDALNQYEKLHPEIFKPRTTPPTKGMKQDIPVDNNLSIAQDFLNLLPDLFVTPAYATNCFDVCDSNFLSCKAGCCRCKWYRPWCCACRTGCYAKWAGCYYANCK